MEEYANITIGNTIFYSFIFVILILSEISYIKIASVLGIKDKSFDATTKDSPITGAGIIFPIAVIIWGCFYGLYYHFFLIGLIILCAICLVDDARQIAIKYRLMVQIISILLLLLQFEAWTTISIPILSILLIICLAVINEFNFMDGIDGITGLYSLSVLIPIMILNHYIPFIDWSFLLLILFAIVIFCYFNIVHSCKCFAGDTGSIGIAYIFCFLIGAAIINSDDIWWIIFLSVYGVDASLTIIRRIFLKESLLTKHKRHLYQILAYKCGIPHLYIGASYSFLQLLISLGLIFLPVNKTIYSISIIIILGILYFILISRFSGRGIKENCKE